jgi:hypothetical protein
LGREEEGSKGFESEKKKRKFTGSSFNSQQQIIYQTHQRGLTKIFFVFSLEFPGKLIKSPRLFVLIIIEDL